MNEHRYQEDQLTMNREDNKIESSHLLSSSKEWDTDIDEM